MAMLQHVPDGVLAMNCMKGIVPCIFINHHLYIFCAILVTESIFCY